MENILDYSIEKIDGEKFVKINLATAGQRFTNFLIDYIVCMAIEVALIFVIDNTEITIGGFFSYSIVFNSLLKVIYFSTMEIIFGKTIGKFITNTRVITAQGKEPNAGQIIGRSFARIIPFEAFSFLGEKAIGWHDKLSNTRVIDDVENNSSNIL